MDNVKMYKKLYYLCFSLSLVIFIISLISSGISDGFFTGFVNMLLFSINLILSLILIVSFVKKKMIKNVSIIFPVSYLTFMFAVTIIAIVYNSILLIPFIHINYYISFILFNYLLLNVYSILSISK